MDDRILLKLEVCARCRFSPATLDRLEAAGNFPRRFGLTGKLNGKVGWWETEVDSWLVARSQRILKPPSNSLDGDQPPLPFG